jgi:hypothetical protein
VDGRWAIHYEICLRMPISGFHLATYVSSYLESKL